MRRWLTWCGLAGVTAIGAHAGLMLAAPGFIMNRAIERIEKTPAVNGWSHAPRVTEASRAVVRPSPDLAYSACVYDLSDGPMRVRVSPWGSYFSVSFYAANSDNYEVLNDRSSPQGVDVLLVAEGAGRPDFAGRIVTSPTMRGVILQRRLAPTLESFSAADAARRTDRCERLAGA